jgi:hypothetical protein
MNGSLKAVVLALPDDLAALVLLEHIQEHLADKREKVRFIALMNELRWAEAFTMLDSLPLHEFVSATQTEFRAAHTPYSQDCTIVKGSDMTGPDSMSDAFLNLFDGPMLTKFYAAGTWCVSLRRTSRSAFYLALSSVRVLTRQESVPSTVHQPDT